MALDSASQNQRRSDAPEVVVARLPQYVRILTRLLQEGAEVVSSQQLGEKLQVTPAQIRKDLSYFGRFGKQGRGYSVIHLLERLKLILGLNSFWNVAVVGVGRLGRAILSYPGFTPDGFHIVAAFDSNPDVVGETIAGLTVSSLEELDEVIQEFLLESYEGLEQVASDLLTLEDDPQNRDAHSHHLTHARGVTGRAGARARQPPEHRAEDPPAVGRGRMRTGRST